MKFSDETAKKIINVLEERGANKLCPRCGHDKFSIVKGYFNQYVEHIPYAIGSSNTAISSIIVVCKKCGFVAQHALSVLFDEEEIE